MEYKVGDKVKLKAMKHDSYYDDCLWIERMKEDCIVTIKWITTIAPDRFHIVGDTEHLSYSFAMIDYKVSSFPTRDILTPMVEFSQLYKRRVGKSNIGLPNDVDEVKIPSSKNIVIVKLTDGRVGKSKCMHGDTFDAMVGFKNAYYNAKNDKVGTLKKVLESCIKSADKKGYKVAILKNRNR